MIISPQAAACLNWHAFCKNRIEAVGPFTAVPTWKLQVVVREAKMTKYKLEYIWLDGYTPVANLRGKTQIKEFASFPTLEELPL